MSRKKGRIMKKTFLFVFAAIAAVCMSLCVASISSGASEVHAETKGVTPKISATKYLKSTDESMMLLATGISDYQDCYECGYITEGVNAITYNTAVFYTSISLKGGTKIWTTEDIFGSEYTGMIIWEVKNISTEPSFTPYVKVGDRDDDGNLSYDSENEVVKTGNKKSIAGNVNVDASYTGLLLSDELDDFASSGKALTFEYKATGSSFGTDTEVFSLWTADGNKRLTNIFSIDVESHVLKADTTGNIMVDSPAGLVEDKGDGWHKVTINCADMPINVGESADGTEALGLIFFNTVNRSFLVKNVKIEEENIHSGAYNFSTSSSAYDFGASPSTSGVALDKVIILDVKFATSGNFNFYLNEYWFPKYCGLFTVTSSGTVTGSGASIESIDDGWYRVKIDLNKAAKAGDPSFVSRVNIQAGTATGYVKYIGFEEPDIHADKFAFAASTAKDYYFVENYNSNGVTLDKVITIDIKFTSAGNFNFYLNEGWFGRWCGQFSVTSSGTVTGSGASIESIDDGWYRVTIDLASAAKSTTNPAFVSRINILNTGTGAGYVMYMGYDGPVVYTPGNGDSLDLPETITSYTSSDKYLTFKLKPVDPASTGTIQMKLASNSADLSYGIRLVFNEGSAPTNGRAIASVEGIDDGWYLITTQTCKQITGSAGDVTKLKFAAYSGYPSFYLKDLEVH